MQNTEEFRKKKTLISAILDIELDMFIRVPTNGICRCKEDLDSLRIHRKAQFMAWSLRTLESYLDDLEVAQRTGLNLMHQKYAIMNKQIDGQIDDHIFDRILDIQLKWQVAVIEKYPHMMRQARPLSAFADTDDCISFETYLRGELASYSRRTLRLLYEDFRIKLAQGINISEEIYSFLAIDLGYASLQEAEMMAK
ncbi:MAG: DUF4125 family protein [Desulfobacterales bacterium]|jgi:hypothetical protein